MKTFVLDKQAQNKPTPTEKNTPEKKEVKIERGKFINLVDDIQFTNIKDARKTVSLPSNSIIQILEVHTKGEGEKQHNLVKLEICLDGGASVGKQPVKGIFVIEESDLKGVEIKEENSSDYGNCKEIAPESQPEKSFPDKAEYKLSKKKVETNGKDKATEVKPKEENKSPEKTNPDHKNNDPKTKERDQPGGNIDG